MPTFGASRCVSLKLPLECTDAENSRHTRSNAEHQQRRARARTDALKELKSRLQLPTPQTNFPACQRSSLLRAWFLLGSISLSRPGILAVNSIT